MAFPRLSALAEVVWTPRERKDFRASSRGWRRTSRGCERST